MTNEKQSKSEKVIAFVSLWVARFVLAVLAFAGCYHILGGVDQVLATGVSVVLVGFLLKETL